jgi:hypothetical protein
MPVGDGPGAAGELARRRLPSPVATFRAALALLIIELLPDQRSVDQRCAASYTHRTVVAVHLDVQRLPQDHLLFVVHSITVMIKAIVIRVQALAPRWWPGRLPQPRLLQRLAAARWASAMSSLIHCY